MEMITLEQLNNAAQQAFAPVQALNDNGACAFYVSDADMVGIQASEVIARLRAALPADAAIYNLDGNFFRAAVTPGRYVATFLSAQWSPAFSAGESFPPAISIFHS